MSGLRHAAMLLVGAAIGCGTHHEVPRGERPSLADVQPNWADALVDDLAPAWPDDHRRPFLEAVAPAALRSAAERCLPPSVTVAQAALESGWGRSDKAVELHNLFGMKAAEDQAGADAPTWEVVDGRRVDITARFRTFESWDDAVVEHDRHLVEHPAYAKARERRGDWRAFVGALAPVYATDPAYADRVHDIVERYGLEALDAPALQRARSRGRCG